MNRNKRSLTQKTQKKMKKEIRTANAIRATQNTQKEVAILTEKELKKRFPKRISPIVNSQSIPLLKKGLKKKSVSKRTTPGLLKSRSAAPAHVHSEGKRWIKTLKSQAQSEKVIQTRRSTKRK